MIVLAKLSSGPLSTTFGDFEVSVFCDGNEEAVVLKKGDLGGQQNVICRIHSECLSSHVFLSKECDCRQQMIYAQELISNKECGIIIYLHQEGRGNGAAAHVSTLELKRKGIPQNRAYEMQGYQDDVRNYRIAAKILEYLQVRSIKLISSNLRKKRELESLGVNVSEMIDWTNSVTIINQEKSNILGYISGGIHQPIHRTTEHARIFTVGDLNVDYIFTQESFLSGGILQRSNPVVGGTAFHAACALADEGFQPIVFGKVGADHNGSLIKKELRNRNVTALLGETTEFQTGECIAIFFNQERNRYLIQQDNNANDYDISMLNDAIKYAQIGEGDMVFLVGHEFVRSGSDKIRELTDTLASTGAALIFDIVPHNVFEKIQFGEFREALGNKISVLIGEYPTFMYPTGEAKEKQSQPTNDDYSFICQNYMCQYLVIRYGVGNISRQVLIRRDSHEKYSILENEATGYEDTPDRQKTGYGDRLTAKILRKLEYDILGVRNAI